MDTRPSPTPPISRSKSTVSTSGSANNPAQTGTPPPSAAVASSSKQARRPSISAESSSSKAAEKHDRPTRTSSNISLKSKGSKKLDDAATNTKNEERMKGYAEDFINLRTIITCKICDKLLYEPYVIACGHIYCYGCLCHWFGQNKKRKTCPDCRTLVNQIPSPAYLIREMASIFLNRPEHLPAGDTVEQHETWRKEEAEAVQQDRDNQDPRLGGLFKGAFKATPIRPHRAPIRDFEDNVDRCPNCHWELEGGECLRCGFQLDDIEFHLSDIDHSELDGSSEDIDGDIDIDYDIEMEGGDYDEDDLEAFAGDYPYPEEDYIDQNSYAVRRWLGNPAGARPNIGGQASRRPAAHSAAGSRRRYSASITSASDRFTEDLEMLEEEEEEEDMDDGDSSMNEFVDDGPIEQSSNASESINGQTPQPPVSVDSSQLRRTRNRRVVESETSSIGPGSTQNDDDNDEDDDDEEGGPVRPGRQRRQQRVLARANGGAHRTTLSVSTDNSAENDLDEHTQHFLRDQGWSPLQHGPEEDMEEEEGDESDGGRTTVGWEQTADLNARPRITNSLTPVADRPSTQARPRSRIGQTRFPDGSRGLRRRSSVLSVSTTNYEDGEADDDDSEIDRDGDIVMNGGQLRNRPSRIRLNVPLSPQRLSRSARPVTLGDGLDADDDDNSDDTSIQSPRRRQLGHNRQEYNPRISLMFAQHQNEMQAALTQQLHWLEELRSTTPVARPRTANRNRNSSSITPTPFSPLSNAAPFSQSSPLATPIDLSPRIRRADRQVLHPSTGDSNGRSERVSSATTNNSASSTSSPPQTRLDREASIESTLSGSTLRSSLAPLNDEDYPLNRANNIPQSVTSGSLDPIERPASRLPARPPSTSGRRGSQGFISAYPGLQMPPSTGLGGPGLNYAQRTWQAQTRNPYSAFIHPMHNNALRPRQSSQRLREQSSTATLRPSGSRRALRPQQSRADVRDEVAPPGIMRGQRSRIGLRAQPSTQRLHGQPSTRALRQAEVMQIPQVNSSANGTGTGSRSSGAISSRLSEDERRRRANELIQARSRELSTTNPFASNIRRTSISGASNAATHAPSMSYGANGILAGGAYSTYLAGNIPGASTSASANSGPQGTYPASPTMNRRRSTRNIALQAVANSPAQQSNGFTGVRQTPAHPSVLGTVAGPASALQPVPAASYAS